MCTASIQNEMLIRARTFSDLARVASCFVGITILVSCDPGSLALPPGSERFSPPAVYDEWWSLTEGCSGKSGDFSRISWYIVPGVSQIPLGDGHTEVNARWDSSTNRIILAGGADADGELVRHEMLHALLQTKAHPRSEFISKCAGVVVCTTGCITDAGPPPPANPNAIAIDPSRLNIGVALIPAVPRETLNGGNFMMVISAENRDTVPVIARLSLGGNDFGSSFSFRIVDTLGNTASYDMPAEVPEVTWFAPREVKQFIFDFRIAAGDPRSRFYQALGTFTFGGAYGRSFAPNPPTITISH
jgi:hypothetical protein